MQTSGGAARRVVVRIGPQEWREEVERYGQRSPARAAAQRERCRLEDEGVALSYVQRCADDGADGTRLTGLLKVYVPISAGPASERPFGFVLSPGRDEHGLYLSLVAFGERHPRAGVRSVYERAHKRLRGRYPDQ